MIIGDDFVWLHLPKTGGTSLRRLFRERALPGVAIDPDDDRRKHDSIALRESRGGWTAGGRRRFITFRPVHDWLVSDHHHKRQRMNLPDLPFEPLRRGLFFSLRLGGVWVPADWWLDYFDVDERVGTLHLDHLQDDLDRHLLPLLPHATAPFGPVPIENARQLGPDATPTLTPDDRARIAAANPRWTAWAQRTTGQGGD